ncbi:hypothetical protein B0H11DRAFT_272746 [Mycena galericulata]|nr:hypothetical protein B0H11DRAFT_272746 [Mycena galericulata]
MSPAPESPSSSSSSSSSSESSPATDYSQWSPTSGVKARSSPVHAASLVDPSVHSPEVMQLVSIELSKPLIQYVVECVTETVDYVFGRTSPRTRGRTPHKRFTSFVARVLTRAEVAPATVLVTLVYIARARPHLSIALAQWARERVFLGALIAAAKYTNDSTLRNVHWALCTGVFGPGDIGRIEREFLDVLDWELGVSEADLVAHHEALVGALALPVPLPLPIRSVPAKEEEGPRVPEPVPEPIPEPALALHRASRHHSSVPDLEPSSPQSSAGSMSPRTPASQPMDVDGPTSTLASTKPHAHAHAHAGKPHLRLHDLLYLRVFHPHHHEHGHERHAIEVAA